MHNHGRFLYQTTTRRFLNIKTVAAPFHYQNFLKMDWFKLLPSYFVPGHPPDHLRDFFIILTAIIALLFVAGVLWQTITSLRQTKPYLDIFKGSGNASDDILKSELPLILELRHHLVDFPARDGQGHFLKRRTVDADEIFRDTGLGPAYASSRFMLAIPSILTGLGVLGTFIGLALGLGSLEMSKGTEAIEGSIKILIPTFAAAFSSSVWGVGMSIICSGIEKFLEAWTLGRVRKIQCRIDDLFPRYVPEEAMLGIETTSRRTEELLQNLAVAIGAEMQKAIGRLGAEIQKAVSDATSQGHGPLMEKSAELLSAALTAELASLKEQIGSMAEQFSEKFNGASLELASSVQGFQPTIEILTATVGNAQQTVFDAVTKLNSHEKVMEEMASAAIHIQEAAVTFGSMNETLRISAERNENAANAQLQVAHSNQAVVDQFEKINAGFSDMQQTIDAAARVIGSLGSPIADLQTLLASQPELQKELENTRATSESERSQLLLSMASNLAEKVGIAAQQFSEVSILADKLTTSAESLQDASQGLAIFGQNIMDASKDQRDASEASRAAAYSGEKVAKAMESAMESIPNSIANLTRGLESAGSSVRDGALAAKGSYEELNVFQKQWFAGVELGLNAMKDQLQSLIQSYGDQVEGQTRNLMKQWTDEVTSSLQSYTTQVEVLQGGLDELQGAINKFRK